MAEDTIAFQAGVSAFTVELRVLLICFSAKSIEGLRCFLAFFLCFFQIPTAVAGCSWATELTESDGLLTHEAACFPPIFPAPQSLLLPALLLICAHGKPVGLPEPPRNCSCFWCVRFQLENKLHWLRGDRQKSQHARWGWESVASRGEEQDNPLLAAVTFWQQD